MAEPARRCVIYNPAAGRGLARRLVERFRSTPGFDAELRPTEGPGHGEELARVAAVQGFGTVVAAGGDGTVHEVANGVLRADTPGTVFAVWPVGSANDYAWALGWRKGWAHDLAWPAAGTLAADVGRITAPDGRSRYFVNGLGLGFNGAVTVEARRIRWLRGMPLYGLAFLKAIVRHFDQPLMTVTLDGQATERPTLALTVSLGRREGGFLLTPQAKLDDGLFDYLHAGGMWRWELLRYLPRMATGTLPTDHPKLAVGRCRSVAVRSEKPLRIHLDGEFVCQPEDGLREVTVELLPGRLRVETFAPGDGR
jgi:diacylglycerol kinase family enzyme